MGAARKPLRAAMPIVAAWVDEMRDAFGADIINAAIRNGMAGGCDFYASENGYVIGYPPPAAGMTLNADQLLSNSRAVQPILRQELKARNEKK